MPTTRFRNNCDETRTGGTLRPAFHAVNTFAHFKALNPTDPCTKVPAVEIHNKKAAPGVTGGRFHDQRGCDSRQGDGGAGGRISFTVASATESGVKGAAPGVRPFNLKMYAMAAA